MKTKKPTKNKETVLSVLQEIRDILKHPKIEISGVTETPTLSNEILVDFPSITAKEIYEQSSNSVDGGKLFYDIDWYKDEDFFTKEKTRPGKRYISKELLYKGQSWNAINEKTSPKIQMLNMAEVMYLLWKYPEFPSTLSGWNYTWTSSRDSDGGLVYVGDFVSGGAGVGGGSPGGTDSGVGVCFSRSE